MGTAARSNGHRPPLPKEEAAAYLGVSVRWILRAVAERRIPVIRVGRHLRFSPDDLDAYLERQRQEAVTF